MIEEVKKNSIKGRVKELSTRWFITAFTGMAHGLFATLIAGTILALIAKLIGDNFVGNLLNNIANIAKMLMGAGIGIGIANQLKAHRLIIYTAGVTGFIGAFADKIVAGEYIPSFAPGNPISAYVVSLITIELCLLYAGKTKLDIILIPIGMMLMSFGAVYVAIPFIWLIGVVARGIEISTDAVPLVMGIVVSVVMGIVLTMPTSSAAIWMSIASGVESDAMLLAGGAAVVGCAAHMIGFAVQSYRENGFSGFIAQGIGTSMLQIPNIMRKPRIMLPPIIASAIVGPLSTTVFKLYCNAAGGGMGTSGLVGVFGVIEASMGRIPQVQMIVGIVLLMFIIPAVVCYFVSEYMRKKEWIMFGDMKLD